MTNAAVAATILGGVLRRRDANYAARFQKLLARHNATPWLLATNEDFRFPGTEGDRPRSGTWLVQRYLDRVIVAGLTHRDIFVAFLAVAHMLAGPASLFRPRVMVRVLWHVLTQRGPITGAEAPAAVTAAPTALPEPTARTAKR
jgi:hypothetical protein